MSVRAVLGAASLAGLLSAGVSCHRDTGEAFQPLNIGAPVPAYTARSLAGQAVRIGGVEPPTVLTVWATWCASCRAEMGALDSLYREFGVEGVRVIAVSVDDGDDGPMRRYVESSRLPFTVAQDPTGSIEQSYQLIGVPTTFVIGGDGRLVWRHTGDISDTLDVARAAVRQAVKTATALRR